VPDLASNRPPRLALTLLALALVALWPRGALALVTIEVPQGLETAALRQSLELVLAAHASHLEVVVRATPGAELTDVLMTARARGAVLLERRYELTPGDWASLPDLLSLVLDRFLTDLPVAPWSVEPLTVVETRPETRAWDLSLWAGAAGAPTQVGDVELGLGVEVGGGEHRLALSAQGRAAMPRQLGDGEYSWVTGLVGVAWVLPKEHWRTWLGVSAGLVRLTGMGFDENVADWLPWAEVEAALLLRFAAFTAGPVLAFAPLSYEVRTNEASQSGEVPRLRVALRLGWMP
jgi:hypothetical protein